MLNDRPLSSGFIDDETLVCPTLVDAPFPSMCIGCWENSNRDPVPRDLVGAEYELGGVKEFSEGKKHGSPASGVEFTRLERWWAFLKRAWLVLVCV